MTVGVGEGVSELASDEALGFAVGLGAIDPVPGLRDAVGVGNEGFGVGLIEGLEMMVGRTLGEGGT
ncbi:MAG: hypothetical protein WCP88_03885 [bacterium]